MTLILNEDHISAARTVLTAASARGDDVSQLWYALSVTAEELARKRHDELRAFPVRHAIDRPQPYRGTLDEQDGTDTPATDPEQPTKRKWFPWS